jgi:tetratricopeptide (TPR) repeat protein
VNSESLLQNPWKNRIDLAIPCVLFIFLFILQSEVPIFVSYALVLIWTFLKRDRLSLPSVCWPMLVFLFVLMLQFFFGGGLERKFLVFLRYGCLLLLYPLVLAQGEQARKNSVTILLGICLFMGLGGLWQSFLSNASQPLSWGEPALFKRAYGLFDNPNLFGSFLLIIFLFLCVRFKTQATTKNLLMLVFIGVILQLTQSRGALVSVLGVSAFLALFRFQRRFWVGVFFLMLFGFLASGRLNTMKRSSLGVNQRVELIRGIGHYLKKHWLFGTGSGSFNRVYPRYRTLGGYYPFYAHNHILEVFCENGIFGVVLFGAFLLYLLHKAFRLWVSNPNLPCFPILLGVLINSQFNSSYSFFGICVLGLFLALEGMELPSKGRKYTIPLFAVLLVLFVMLLSRAGLKEYYKSKNFTYMVQERQGSWVNRDLTFGLQVLARFVATENLSPEEKGWAVFWFNELKACYPRESEVYKSGALLFKHFRDKKSYKKYLKKALELDPFSESIAHLHLRVLMDERKWDEFDSLYQKILFSNPNYRRINILYDQIQALVLKSMMIRKQWGQLQLFRKKLIWVNPDFGEKAEEMVFGSGGQ